MNKVLRYFISILYLPVWWLQRIFPRKKNLWVFGGWYGLKYSDNSKCLFEYVDDNENAIECVWITKSDDIMKKLRNEGRKSALAFSIEGIFYLLRAGYVVFSSGKNDVNPYFINGAVTINTWHGAPMKKIGQDDKYGYERKKDAIIKIFFPYIREYGIDGTVSTADVFTPIMQSAFNLKPNNVCCSGYPRNDLFFLTSRHPLLLNWDKSFNSPRKIIYLPTFRDHSGNFRPFRNYGFDESLMHDLLTETNSILISKGHYIDNEIGGEVKSDRIIHLNDKDVDDLNYLLKDTDILITDYSGVYFDFLITEKPILFAPFDIEDYLLKHRELYFDYNTIVCGPLAKNWSEVVAGLRELMTNDTYAEVRKEKNRIFNKFHDNNNSKRLFNSLMEFQSKES
jgi:CDP-glycerol glycerophosphotransferase (TagB/SpsB family)